MRLTHWMAAALVLSLTTPALAQEWDNFVFAEDGFSVNFPGRPQVENTTWISQYRYELPARVYSASRGSGRYSVTVVDYRDLQKLGEERWEQCPPGAETCIGNQGGSPNGVTGPGYDGDDLLAGTSGHLARGRRRYSTGGVKPLFRLRGGAGRVRRSVQTISKLRGLVSLAGARLNRSGAGRVKRASCAPSPLPR